MLVNLPIFIAILRIIVEKSGSSMYASVPKRTCVETADLNLEERIKFEELVRDSNFFNLSTSLPNQNAADFTAYRITIESETKNILLREQIFQSTKIWHY